MLDCNSDFFGVYHDKRVRVEVGDPRIAGPAHPTGPRISALVKHQPKIERTRGFNGKPWTEFNKDKETITVMGLTGTVAVTAQY
jgi:hypothetical protein